MTTARYLSQHREASLNWIAFGLLLAAWNASDNDPVPMAEVARMPAPRNHSYVSVRAVSQHRAVIKAST